LPRPCWAPAAAASKCLIINDALNASYRSLQAAQDAAAAGATLWVRGGCVGTTTVTKDLTLTGQQPPGFTSPTLDGAGQASVLSITGGFAVTINTLTIRGGDTGSTNFKGGGGILNDQGGTVTLNGSTITGNRTSFLGGGIFNSGTVTLNDSTVSNNGARNGGGGISNRAGSTVTLNGSSSITRNTAFLGGGIFNDPGGTVNLNGGTVTDNIPDDIYP
jgi:hypothetical protein